MLSRTLLAQGRQPIRRPLIRVISASATLAFIIASTANPVLAQAGTLLMTVTGHPEFCVHHSYPIQVDVTLSYNHTRSGRPADLPMTGFWIRAKSSDPNIGTVSPPQQVAGFASLSDDIPGKETFTFSAKKVGRTWLSFDADLPRFAQGGHAANGLSVEVTNCKYKVTSIIKWADPDGYASIVAETAEALLTSDGNGNYTGSASTKFSGYMTCIEQGKLQFAFTRPKANWTGTVVPGGIYGDQLIVKLTIPSVAISVLHTCFGNKAPSLTGDMEALSFTVPYSGGSSNQSSVLNVTGFTATGSASVHVWRTEGSGK